MQLTEVLENQKEEYNQFVAAQKSGSFLQSWEWGEWQETLGRQVLRYWILSAGGGPTSGGDISKNLIGSIQSIKMPLFGKKYYLYCPYGPVVRDPSDALGMAQLLKQKFTEAVFIRIEPKSLSTNHLALSTKSPNIQPGKTLIINLEKSEEELLAEMHPKTRYNIKVAQKHGVEIKDEFDISIGHGLFFDEALKLILETSKRQKFNTFPAGYYKNLIDFYTLHNRSSLKLHIYKAVFQNQLLAAAIMVDFGKIRTFLFGGSSEFHKNVMAPYLLHWQAMRDAKALGLSTYDFWGIETSSGETPGFVRFKLGFGGEEWEYGGAYDIVKNNLWYKVYKSTRTINKFLKSFKK